MVALSAGSGQRIEKDTEQWVRHCAKVHATPEDKLVWVGLVQGYPPLSLVYMKEQ